MEDEIENKLERIPILNYFIKLLKNIPLPALEGLTLYYFLRLYGKGIIKGAVTSRASAIAFSFFTAIFPFLLFIIILIPYIPVVGFEYEFKGFLNSILPPQTSDFFFENIFQNIMKGENVGLISTVFLLSIFLMANGISALFSGFESSYHQQLTRSVVKQYLYSLFVALILVFLLIITIAVLGYFQIYVIQRVLYFMDKQGYETYEEGLFMIAIAKYVFFVFMVYIATATLYYFGTKEGKNSKFFSAGALLTTILIIVFSYLFGIYVTYFSTYNELYGSIGALLILLFYLWLNSNILLLGFELNATIRRLKKYNDSKKKDQILS
ncbi:YihY/virulence factor BrkB family protein [Gelidibacter salicanalis]|uniref:YihY/virulence factor BrkB family protein n=1 Tax=Gelidibacter salicanalis TaxID=291193 RepID=A0A934NKQ1_9FLAO|nr:YihY/virulence factor BrkB family protein [Gelidibacter salicanalis]MBJ7881762.1 YihY/virulence factor BrkB family protein [Gelidibacter salicanalis]